MPLKLKAGCTPKDECIFDLCPDPTKPKARKRKGQKMLVRWLYIDKDGCEWIQNTRAAAIGMRKLDVDCGLPPGQIARGEFTLPAPAGRGKK